MPAPAEAQIDEEAALSARRVGQVIADKFRLDKLIGVGGMAAVYAVTHLNNSKRFALKVLHPTITQAEVRKRFLREGYIANQVNHPGAVSVLDDGTDEDGTVFLVMELLEGDSLRVLAEKRGGRVPPKELVRYVIDLLDVLAVAHEAGIIHRDLKADNVFITRDGKVKVLDFGVARIRDTGDGKTRTGIVMGTPEYMPPEQARGRSEQVDGRSDIWAVGAMMFKLLTGHHPHEAETANEVLLLAMTEPAPKISSRLPDIHEKLAELIDTALAFERDDRFKDAKRMQAFAREVLEQLERGDREPTAVGLDTNLIIASAKTLQGETTPASDRVRDDLNEARPRGLEEARGLWVHDKARVAPKPLVAAPRPVRRGLVGALVALSLGAAALGFAATRWNAVTSVVTDASPAPTEETHEEEASAAVLATSEEDAGEEEGEEEENPYAELDAASLPPKPTASIKPPPVSSTKKPPPKITTHHPPKKKH